MLPCDSPKSKMDARTHRYNIHVRMYVLIYTHQQNKAMQAHTDIHVRIYVLIYMHHHGIHPSHSSMALKCELQCSDG